jgi:hypothetical protein
MDYPHVMSVSRCSRANDKNADSLADSAKVIWSVFTQSPRRALSLLLMRVVTFYILAGGFEFASRARSARNSRRTRLDDGIKREFESRSGPEKHAIVESKDGPERTSMLWWKVQLIILDKRLIEE